MKMPVYSSGYRHMICIRESGISEKGLLLRN